MGDTVRYDIDGYEYVTRALWDLVNNYPDLDDTIVFAEVDSEYGKAFIPTSGAVILTETNDITGHTTQDCLYPFTIMYKAGGLSESRKVNVKEWLDNLGRWLERQPVTIRGVQHQMESYPTLKGNREIRKIERTQPSFLSEVGEDNVETWIIALQATYRNEFDR